jgi:hypothetical protein
MPVYPFVSCEPKGLSLKCEHCMICANRLCSVALQQPGSLTNTRASTTCNTVTIQRRRTVRLQRCTTSRIARPCLNPACMGQRPLITKLKLPHSKPSAQLNHPPPPPPQSKPAAISVTHTNSSCSSSLMVEVGTLCQTQAQAAPNRLLPAVLCW